MSSVVVRFCASDDMISAVIRAGCYGFSYSHVEIVLPNRDAIGAHAANGVAVLRRGDKTASETHCQSIVVPCTYNQERACTAFLRTQLGRGYDFRAIAAIAASFFIGPRDWRCENRWFCSELAAAALEHAGIIEPIIGGTQAVTPRDLMLILSAIPGTVILSVEQLR